METLKKCALYALFAALFAAGLIAFTGDIGHSLRTGHALTSSSQAVRFGQSK